MARKAPKPLLESSSDDEPVFHYAQPAEEVESSSSGEEEEEEQVKPPPKTLPTQKKPDPPRPSLQSDTDSDEEEEEEEEDDDEEAPSAPPPSKKAPTHKKPDPPKPAIESDSDSDEEEEEETPPSPPPKKALTQKKSDPPKPVLESESDSDEEEEPKKAPTQKNSGRPEPALYSKSDSDAEVAVPPLLKKDLTQKKKGTPKPTLVSEKVKPIESKPMVKSKLPVTVLASPAVSLASKRSRESDDTKKEKKKAKGDTLEGSNDESGKKPLFQRLWSEEDEVVILQGMIEYKLKNGVDPMSNADNFLEFIKESLHVDVSKVQLSTKVRALKKRFVNSKRRKVIVDPHWIKLRELSNKIWEIDADVKSSVSGEAKDSQSGTKKRKAGVEKSKRVKEDVNGAVLEDEKVEEEEKLQDWVVSRRETALKLDDLGNCGFVKDGVLKEMINLLDEGQKAKIREKWKKYNLQEMELYLKRLDILKEMTQQTLNAMKST